MVRCEDDNSGETPFVKFLNFSFEKLATQIIKRPWTFLIFSTLLTLGMVAKIPFTEMTNDVSDFTPYEAMARKYEEFFSNKGSPVAIFALVTAKNEGNLLGINQLRDTVDILDTISDKFKVYNPKTDKNESFSELCGNFCILNEPVRHFYNGFIVNSGSSNDSELSDHIDLGYPITTVLGRQLRMDPNFFGVKVAIPAFLAPKELLNISDFHNPNATVTMSVNQLRDQSGHSIFDEGLPQVSNNVREIKLIGLQFRIERPIEISRSAIAAWERSMVEYFQKEYHSEFVDVVILTESHLTSEIVRAGLTLIPFLVIGFIIMVIFSSITMTLAAVYMRQMHYTKIALAVMACVCPFMACGTAMGLLFFLGFRFGTILCVTPFLVLAIGVDDAYLMVNSWQRVRKEKRESDSHSTTGSDKSSSTTSEETLKDILTAVFIDTAPSITITTLTNVLAFGVGALTPTPEIQLFSIGNAIAITFDYIYQWTIYGSFMAIVGKLELSANGRGDKKQIVHLESSEEKSVVEGLREKCRKNFEFLMKSYCRILTNGVVSSFVMASLAVYWYLSIYGILNTKAELQPDRLFLKSSDVIQIMHLRNEYIMPFYAVCMVFVNNPGNFSDPSNIRRWHNLVSDFEALPSSLGKFSTKFFMRDYEIFVTNAEESFKPFSEEFDDLEFLEKKKNELKPFLEWPEFDFWNGFVNLEENQTSGDVELKKFFFTTAAYGPELKEWSNRAKLLEDWRRIANSYPDLEVSIYEDDAKFLDLIPTLISQTAQSSFWTFICMIVVCLLVITHPTTVTVAGFAIFSTCIGVFGFLSLWGVELDPIVMSCGIMSIGFSVDIPAHISYHFYKSGLGKSGSSLSVQERIEHTLITVGFPVIEAGVSTNVCVLTMVFVDLHMAKVFVKTMVLVVSIGLIHGLFIIPVIFYLISLVPNPRKISEKQNKVSQTPEIIFEENSKK
ncbi:hypothetical protein FO519_008523 [Halicephalobus sp. NKZ332]|nr:hypothetical protein FO519_008523 [Halicephalobus sp. NKZ332]